MIFFRRTRYLTVKPKISNESKNVRILFGTFEKCDNCLDCIHKDVWKENLNVCPNCSYHRNINAKKRIEILTDKNSFQEIDCDMTSVDILSFNSDFISYADKYNKNVKKNNINEAILCGSAKIKGTKIAIGVMDFNFLGASMGSVVGEKVTRLIEFAINNYLPLIIVTASGGARMYEGIFSLMQMAKTSGAINRYCKLNLPYIVVMTHPTTGGVTASFASLGDLIVAESNALIGFAGPRVITNTTKSKLPKEFQKSEFLLKNGLIDRIIDRRMMKEELFLLIKYFKNVN